MRKASRKYFTNAFVKKLLFREMNYDFIEINGYQHHLFSLILTWISLNTHASTETVSIAKAFLIAFIF